MITEEEKEKALELLSKYEAEQKHQIRDSVKDDCPSKEFEKGNPSGECEGDGHYMCIECINYKRE